MVTLAASSGAAAPPAGLERRFHALADEKRLRIADLLRHGERCVCEIAGELGLAQSLLSFHLRTLKEAGLVNDRRVGRWVYYSLDPDALDEMRGFVGALASDGAASAAGGPGCC